MCVHVCACERVAVACRCACPCACVCVGCPRPLSLFGVHARPDPLLQRPPSTPPGKVPIHRQVACTPFARKLINAAAGVEPDKRWRHGVTGRKKPIDHIDAVAVRAYCVPRTTSRPLAPARYTRLGTVAARYTGVYMGASPPFFPPLSPFTFLTRRCSRRTSSISCGLS
jgi:hypothetical protein